MVDGEAVGTIGEPVATGGTEAPVPVLPAVPPTVPVAKPEEPPETPVELSSKSDPQSSSTHVRGIHLSCAVFVQEQTLS